MSKSILEVAMGVKQNNLYPDNMEIVTEAPGDEDEEETEEEEDEEVESEDYTATDSEEDTDGESDEEEETQSEDYTEEQQSNEDDSEDDTEEPPADVEEEDEEEIEAEDYSAEEPEDDVNDEEGEDNDEDENLPDDNLDNEEEDSSTPDSDSDESTSGGEEDSDKAETRNQTILHEDYINLYNSVKMTIDRINTIDKSNVMISNALARILQNLRSLQRSLWEYVVYDYYKVKYVTNLYKYDHFYEALRINVQMLEKTAEFIPDSQNN